MNKKTLISIIRVIGSQLGDDFYDRNSLNRWLLSFGRKFNKWTAQELRQALGMTLQKIIDYTSKNERNETLQNPGTRNRRAVPNTKSQKPAKRRKTSERAGKKPAKKRKSAKKL